MAEEQNALDILVVEPSLSWRNVIVQTLRSKFADVTVRECGVAQQALLMAQAPPDLVIAELDLPGMNGRELIRRLRSTDQARRTQVILMGENVDPNLAMRLVECDIQGFLVKPFSVLTMVERVEKILRSLMVAEDALRIRPRNAVRRAIRETIYIHRPVRLLTPTDICIDAGLDVMPGVEMECDFYDMSRLLGIRQTDQPLRCVVRGMERLKDRSVVRIRLRDRREELEEAIERLFTKRQAQEAVLPLDDPAARVGIPARTFDMAALGIGVTCPIQFHHNVALPVDIWPLIPHVFSNCLQGEAQCEVIRSVPHDSCFELGLAFVEAPAEFLGDVLHWSAGEPVSQTPDEQLGSFRAKV